MTLTEADVRRLGSAGHTGFFRETWAGDLELKNRSGRCVFLVRGKCDVYAIRPEGCRLYPLVLNLGDESVASDEFCPHREEFPFDRAEAEALRLSVARETAEAKRRRGWAGG